MSISFDSQCRRRKEWAHVQKVGAPKHDFRHGSAHQGLNAERRTQNAELRITEPALLGSSLSHFSLCALRSAFNPLAFDSKRRRASKLPHSSDVLERIPQL